MANESRLDERTGWGHLWSSSEWRRYFLVLTPGALRIFSCDQRNKLEKSLSLARCMVGIYKPFSSQESSLGKNKRLWKNLAKLVASEQCFSQMDIAVVTIKPRKGKICFLMFPSQTEGQIWKTGVEEAGVLADLDTSTKYSKGPSKRSNRLERASDALNNTRMLLKTNSLLKKPFGLRWEAHPPLLKVKEFRVNSSCEVAGRKGEGAGTTDRVEIVDVKPVKPLWDDLETLRGCADFLRSSCLNFLALKHAASMVDHFKGSYQMGDSSLPDELRLEAWKGTARRIVKSLVDEILSSNLSMESCFRNEDHMDQLWLAGEVWVLGAVHDKIMGACKQMFAIKDASLDEILMKLQKVDPSTLGVRAEFEIFVLGEALEQFRELNRLRTPYEKALCLQKTVKCIIDGIQKLIKSCTGALKDTEGLLPCTDDLLSFMLLLMARAKVKNLHANACYMENFINLQKDTNRGELVYHITNFVAACDYLHSSAIQELVANFPGSSENDVSSGNQIQNSADESWSRSPSLSKNFTSNSERSSSSTDVGQKRSQHPVSPLSRSYSLESDANSRSRDDKNWEGVVEDSSCFDMDAFNYWRSSDSLAGSIEENISEFNSVTRSVFINSFSEQTRNGWTEMQDLRGNNATFQNVTIFTSKKEAYTLPGNSPDFILAPTYD